MLIGQLNNCNINSRTRTGVARYLNYLGVRRSRGGRGGCRHVAIISGEKIHFLVFNKRELRSGCHVLFLLFLLFLFTRTVSRPPRRQYDDTRRWARATDGWKLSLPANWNPAVPKLRAGGHPLGPRLRLKWHQECFEVTTFLCVLLLHSRIHQTLTELKAAYGNNSSQKGQHIIKCEICQHIGPQHEQHEPLNESGRVFFIQRESDIQI